MCKTYDAIYELQKTMETNVLVAWIDGAKLKGELYCCEKSECKCLKEIVSLKNVHFTCTKTGTEAHLKWLNIPSKWIKAFAFECCLEDK